MRVLPIGHSGTSSGPCSKLLTDCFFMCRRISLNLGTSSLTQNQVLAGQVSVYPFLISRWKLLVMYSNAIPLLSVSFENCHRAGRGAKEANLYTEISEGIYSYGVTRHRHGRSLY